MRDSRRKLLNYSTYSRKKTGGTYHADFGGVCVEGIAAVDVVFHADKLFYDIDIVVGSLIGESVRGGMLRSTPILYDC